MKDNNKKIAVKCEANVCPICGSMNLDYGCSEDDDYGRTFPWTCEDCGATGKEGYTEVFDDHYDVKTEDGEAVEIVEPEAAPDPAFINLNEYACPVCGGRIEENGEFYTQEIFLYFPWRCTHCKATGIAEFEDATSDVYYGFNGHGNVHLADGSVWDGEPIPATESAEEEHRSTGSITLLNDFDMEDALLALAVANIRANEEHGRITIIDASVSDAVEALAREGILLQAITYEGNNAPVVAPPAPVKAATGWFVPVTWEMFGVVRIPFEDAPTLADAFKQIKDNPNIELPKGHYVDDSFAPSYEVEQIEEVRSLYNDNRPDGVAADCSSEEECNYTFSDHDGECLADGSVRDGKPGFDPFEVCTKAISPCEPTQDAFINLDEHDCPVCGGRIEENGEFYTQEIFTYFPWRCTHCKATGIAEVEDAASDVYYNPKNVHLADGSVWDGKPISATESVEEDHRISCNRVAFSVNLRNALLDRQLMCFECDSETCAFNPEGVCMYPVVYGKAPDLETFDGCSGWVEKREE